MIISASRRTDIPAFYSDWFINRLKDGYALIKNPRNPNRSSRVMINSDVVDCIVFWTKNAKPMLSKLNTIDAMDYKYYFQFTITPYDKKIEKGLPPKQEIMETFKRLSDKIGSHRAVWRYDPVIVSKEFSVQYHLDTYGKMADVLGDYTDRCIFSFIDLYAKVRESTKGIVDYEVNELNMKRVAEGFSRIAKTHQYTLSTCSEEIDLSAYGITHASCIDKGIVEKIIGFPINAKKDANQRLACGCIESVDIGSYDCCSHGCIYCYATTSQNTVINNMRKHNKNSSILIGEPSREDKVTNRDAKSFKTAQISLF
ncbi:DUF1848 domain-containing protein [Clostridium sp. OS1-26]|uniref:DUF1848 domain-containing protein n=1 Tax=Clostridium sp. OS1-26 TaxID=3070681 RepID=UPI0027E03251|nr:DUF1848 domain-containing protein [Clostridium sp. OS1-26]WML34528.1 DUF1848 domain-containing protein [Clostridium sp. OS1-26]